MMGYTQGMSDLLAPVLAEIQNEADAYWCFTGLMQGTIFVSSPRDSDMDKQLVLSPNNNYTHSKTFWELLILIVLLEGKYIYLYAEVYKCIKNI